MLRSQQSTHIRLQNEKNNDELRNNVSINLMTFVTALLPAPLFVFLIISLKRHCNTREVCNQEENINVILMKLANIIFKHCAKRLCIALIKYHLGPIIFLPSYRIATATISCLLHCSSGNWRCSSISLSLCDSLPHFLQ